MTHFVISSGATVTPLVLARIGARASVVGSVDTIRRSSGASPRSSGLVGCPGADLGTPAVEEAGRSTTAGPARRAGELAARRPPDEGRVEGCRDGVAGLDPQDDRQTDGPDAAARVATAGKATGHAIDWAAVSASRGRSGRTSRGKARLGATPVGWAAARRRLPPPRRPRVGGGPSGSTSDPAFDSSSRSFRAAIIASQSGVRWRPTLPVGLGLSRQQYDESSRTQPRIACTTWSAPNTTWDNASHTSSAAECSTTSNSTTISR